MRDHNEYMARVALCEQRAKDARTENEKQSWLVMADSWRETVKLQEILTRQAEFIRKVPMPRASGRLVMPIDTINTDRLVACPCCSRSMRFARTVPKVGDLPEMETFECKPCRLAVTAEQVLQFPELMSSASA